MGSGGCAAVGSDRTNYLWLICAGQAGQGFELGIRGLTAQDITVVKLGLENLMVAALCMALGVFFSLLFLAFFQVSSCRMGGHGMRGAEWRFLSLTRGSNRTTHPKHTERGHKMAYGVGCGCNHDT